MSKKAKESLAVWLSALILTFACVGLAVLIVYAIWLVAEIDVLNELDMVFVCIVAVGGVIGMFYLTVKLLDQERRREEDETED